MIKCSEDKVLLRDTRWPILFFRIIPAIKCPLWIYPFFFFLSLFHLVSIRRARRVGNLYHFHRRGGRLRASTRRGKTFAWKCPPMPPLSPSRVLPLIPRSCRDEEKFSVFSRRALGRPGELYYNLDLYFWLTSTEPDPLAELSRGNE